MSEKALQAEVDGLRAELESYRQRELEDLRAQLAAARQEASHYKGEALRNAEAGRQIHLEAQEQITKLRAQLETKEQLQRVLNRGTNANATRN